MSDEKKDKKIKADITKFVAERIGKEIYGKTDESPRTQLNIAILLKQTEQQIDESRRIIKGQIIQQGVEDEVPLLDQGQTKKPDSVSEEQSSDRLREEPPQQEHNLQISPARNNDIRNNRHAGRYIIRPKP